MYAKADHMPHSMASNLSAHAGAKLIWVNYDVHCLPTVPTGHYIGSECQNKSTETGAAYANIIMPGQPTSLEVI